MQKRLADLQEINSMQTRWDQYEALEARRILWELQQKKTRRYCSACQCVLYVRSKTDNVPDEKDLDEVYPGVDDRFVYCFRCTTNTQPLGFFSPYHRTLIDRIYQRQYVY